MKNPNPVMVDASSLRHRVQLAKADLASDLSQPFGKPQNPPGSTPYADVWASVTALSGRDLYKAQQFASDVTHQVTIRYLCNVAGGDLVLYRGRKFRVLYPLNPEERDIRLDLFCSEIDGGTVVAT